MPENDFADRLAWPLPASVQLSQIRDLASGLILSSDGYILTSAHVIRNVDDIQVRLDDGRRFRARGGSRRAATWACSRSRPPGCPLPSWATPPNWPRATGWRRSARPSVSMAPSPPAWSAQPGAFSIGGGRHSLHPDRRRHQPRQFRRSPLQQPGRGGGDQCADLQRQWRLHGHLVRGPHQSGAEDRPCVARKRHRPACTPGRRVPGSDAGTRAVVRRARHHGRSGRCRCTTAVRRTPPVWRSATS